MKKVIYLVLLALIVISCHSKESSEISSDKLPFDSVPTTQEESEPQQLMKAPEFSLPDINGKEFSLADFRGKLIYMDIWATWCGPCLVQLPALKEFEEEYRGEDIVFMSISTDPDEDQPKWMNMVKEKQMGGVQLFAGHQSGFTEAYKVEFIPRFVLISPSGDIVLDQAPEPMDYRTGERNIALQQILDLYLTTHKKASP